MEGIQRRMQPKLVEDELRVKANQNKRRWGIQQGKNIHEPYCSGQQASSAHTLASCDNITHYTNRITLGCVGGAARSTAVSVLGDCRKQGGVGAKGGRGVKILLTTASLAIGNSAKFVFIRANRGKQPKRMANTHAHAAGSSLRACKHTSVIQQDGGKQACKHGHTQQAGMCGKCVSWIFFVLLLWNYVYDVSTAGLLRVTQ